MSRTYRSLDQLAGASTVPKVEASSEVVVEKVPCLLTARVTGEGRGVLAVEVVRSGARRNGLLIDNGLWSIPAPARTEE